MSTLCRIGIHRWVMNGRPTWDKPYFHCGRCGTESKLTAEQRRQTEQKPLSPAALSDPHTDS